MIRILFALLAAPFLLAAASSYASPERLSSVQAARELRILERALSDLHPGLYRYQTEPSLKAEFDAARAAVANGADATTMYLLATRIAASVRCGHTWTNPLNQGPIMQASLATLPALPVRVRLLKNRLLVTATTDANIQVNDEILAVDGRSASQLIADFMPYLRADGSSDGKRLAQIDSVPGGGALDRLLPLLYPPRNGRYTLTLQDPQGESRDVSAAGQLVAAREKMLIEGGQPTESEQWRFEIDGDTAYLTLPTFAFWNGEFAWQAFLNKSFNSLAESKIARLVIDLRQNEGGDDAIGRFLLSYLIESPYTQPKGRVESAYERVPYDLARYLDTWDFSFFDRTDIVVKEDNHRWLLKSQPLPAQIVPHPLRYSGDVIALVGPRMSSAGFLLARDLKATKAATLVGEATGGNRRGLNGGQLAWLTLPDSGVAVDIPLIATFYDAEPDAGITPDVVIATAIEDVRNGRDPARQWRRPEVNPHQ